VTNYASAGCSQDEFTRPLDPVPVVEILGLLSLSCPRLRGYLCVLELNLHRMTSSARGGYADRTDLGANVDRYPYQPRIPVACVALLSAGRTLSSRQLGTEIQP